MRSTQEVVQSVNTEPQQNNKESQGVENLRKVEEHSTDTEDHAKNNNKKEPPKKREDHFECNICLDTAEEPVITPCGHLYCWSCINHWITSQSNKLLECPVCKSGIKEETLIPIYGRNVSSSGKSKPRPKATRQEASQNPNYVPQPTQGHAMFGGSLHFGFGSGFGVHFGDPLMAGFQQAMFHGVGDPNMNVIDPQRQTIVRFSFFMVILVLLIILLL